VRSSAKRVAASVSRILMFPLACLAGFGRWYEPYLFLAQTLAMIPARLGSYFRIAYYSFTLEGAGRDSHMGFGSYFVYPDASFEDGVGIGAYCVLGQVDIGEGTQIASHVQILSGSKQHRRDDAGRLTDEGRVFRRIDVGAQCWIGAGVIVMANLGEGATIGSGSVVTRDVPTGATVSGNPARTSVVAEKTLS
jgi:virginiamycin A acetyltransferase